MGEYAIQAAEATYRQALSAGLNTTKAGCHKRSEGLLGNMQ